jgi:hypothetical protein
MKIILKWRSYTGLRPNIALSVRPTNTKLPTKKLIRATAVTGFLNSGARGFVAFKNTPKMTPAMKMGYLETVFQKFCMVRIKTLLSIPDYSRGDGAGAAAIGQEFVAQKILIHPIIALYD